MQDGKRVAPTPSLAESRARATRNLARLPEPLRALEPKTTYPVDGSDALVRLTAEVDRRLAAHEGAL